MAKLAKETAEYYKQQQILEGEGESAKRRMTMQADGQMKLKLDTYLEVQKVWAEAFANYKGSVVPNYVSGGSAGNGNNAVNQFMELQMFKTLKDLGLEANAK